MVLTGTVLLVLAIVLAWSVPLLLASRTRTYSSGRAALDPISEVLMWQAVGLAGGLSLIGAAVVFALAPFADNLHAGFSRLLDLEGLRVLAWWQWILLVAAVALSARLLGCLFLQWRDVSRHRRRHAALVDLLTEPSEDLPNTRVLAADEPVAYCLPGRRSGTTVVSTGLLAVLTPDERRSVVTHEHAHLLFRHELLVLPFAAWNRALPFLPATSVALRSVSSLIELMADDLARRFVAPEVLSSAIARTAEVYPGEYRNDLTVARIERLAAPLPPRTARVRATSAVTAAVLLLAPTAMLVAPLF
ncbi:M56 family metallopeptidase [Brevibacterium samyangense]|uniref:M56 family metallopeptidase n=1 Tax=Brevibacterium samyangense TaxID=366888 RepID=A0ABP5ETG7_9MICO